MRLPIFWKLVHPREEPVVFQGRRGRWRCLGKKSVIPDILNRESRFSPLALQPLFVISTHGRNLSFDNEGRFLAPLEMTKEFSCEWLKSFYVGFCSHPTRHLCFGKSDQNHFRPYAAPPTLLRAGSPGCLRLHPESRWFRNSFRSNSLRQRSRFGAPAPPCTKVGRK